MKLPPHGNGSGNIEICVSDRGNWIVIYPGAAESLPPQLPILLSRTMEGWFAERPHLRPRSATSIVQDGNTVLIHAFYEQVSAPAREMPPRPSGE